MHYNKKIIFMIVTFLALNSTVFSQGISLIMSNMTVKKAVNELKKQTGYSFVYSVEDLDSQKSVSVSVQNGKIEDVVKQILAGQDVSYQIQGKNIVVKKNGGNNNDQDPKEKKMKKVTGVILDEKDLPIVGASVAVKGTTNGVITDMDGGFVIEASENSILVISYIGYETQTVNVNGNASLTIKLVQGVKSLDEVIVTGYSTQKKKNITGSVATMKVSDDLRMAATTSAGNLLTGRLAGVNVSTQNGIPGDQPTISIRTASSFNAQDVLYVIDGVIKGSGDFNNLSPNEIETLTVLKDAAAASIYGSRSAGGVILVTTKRGISGKMKIDYSYSYGQDARGKNAKLASAVDMGKMNNKMYPTSDWRYHTPEDLAFLQTVNNGWGYDQLDEVWSNPTIKTQNFSVSGGTEKVKYFAGVSNVKQTTFIKAYGYDKTNLRFNTTIDLTKDLQFFTGIGFQNQDTDSDSFEGPSNLYRKLLIWQPYQPVFTKGGQYIDYGWIANIGAEADKASGYNKTNNFKPDINLNLTYKIPEVEGLSAKVAFASSWANQHYTEFRKFYKMAIMPVSASGHIIDTDDANILSYRNNTSFTNPYLYKRATWSKDKQLNLQLNYDHIFGKHAVSGVLGYEAFEATSGGVGAGRERVPVYLTDQWWAFSGARADSWVDGTPSDLTSGRKSVLGQANYSYNNKYLATFSFREDGSMQFADDNRWGFFPAASVGWVISEENFFNNIKNVVSRMKLSASAGLTGNDSIGGWQWQESYGQGSTAYFGTTPSPSVGVKYGSIVNPNITWEKTRSYNFGLDFDFLKHFNAVLEYYIQDTYDILGSRSASVPTSFSGTLPAENYGEVKAQGYEFSIGYKNNINKFNYYINANVSRGTNKVITQDYAANAQEIDIPIGKSRNRIIGYQAEPMIRTQADLDAFNTAHPGYKLNGWAPYLGMLPIKDISGPDGIPDNVVNSYDRIEISKDNTPTYFGLVLGGNYKGFSFDMVFSGSAGSLKSYQEVTGNVEWNRMYQGWVDDSWTQENPNASLPMVLPYYDSAATTFRDFNSDFWYKKNNYIRLSYFNIGYNFAQLSHIEALSNLKLYITGSNLFVLGNFNKYWDPQGSAFGYPIMKSFNVGLNIGF